MCSAVAATVNIRDSDVADVQRWGVHIVAGELGTVDWQRDEFEVVRVLHRENHNTVKSVAAVRVEDCTHLVAVIEQYEIEV